MLWVAAKRPPARTGSLLPTSRTRSNGHGAIQSRQIGVQANNGVVASSGNVTSDAKRAAVANDPATIDGVKTVVSNLQVQQTQATPAPTPVGAQQVQPAPAPAHKSQPKPSPRHERRPSVAAPDNFAPAPQPTQLAQSAAPVTPTPAPQVQAAPPPPHLPRRRSPFLREPS